MASPTAVLAAVVFSAASRTAFPFAAGLAQQWKAEVHVLHAEDPLLAASAERGGVDLRAEMLDELRRFCPPPCPGTSCQPRYHVIVGDAVDTVLAIAHRENARAVVVGARGMSADERLAFGSTTEGLLRRANLSVVVVPDDWTPPAPVAPDLSGVGPIVAGIDMTGPSIDAAAAAAALAATLKTQCIFLHVVPEVRVPERWHMHAEAALRHRLDEYRCDLEHVAKSLEAIGPVRLQVVTGSIPHKLVEVAHATPHAMIVLGRTLRPHGYGPPGAIAYRILALARVPMFMHIPS
jgi:nucleotide-binding universal stress UspA family protein